MEDSINRDLQVQAAIQDGDLSRIRKLIALLKPNIDEALLYACRAGKLEVAQYLVDHEKADIDHQDLKGWTALHVACDRGQLEFARWILYHTSASPEIPDLDGEVPLHKLKSVNFKAQPGEALNPSLMFEIMRLLIEEGGADPSATNHEGHTCLDLIKKLQEKSPSDHLPSWVRDRSGVDSYFDFAENDYDLESTASYSGACTDLSLSHYHVDSESDINDYGDNWDPSTASLSDYDEQGSKNEAFYYDIADNESATNENDSSLSKKRQTVTLEDWIVYLTVHSVDARSIDYESFKETPTALEQSSDDEDSTYIDNVPETPEQAPLVAHENFKDVPASGSMEGDGPSQAENFPTMPEPAPLVEDECSNDGLAKSSMLDDDSLQEEDFLITPESSFLEDEEEDTQATDTTTRMTPSKSAGCENQDASLTRKVPLTPETAATHEDETLSMTETDFNPMEADILEGHPTIRRLYEF